MLTLNRLLLRNKTMFPSVNGPMVFNIVKAFFIAVHEALEIVSELNTSFSLVVGMRLKFFKVFLKISFKWR